MVTLLKTSLKSWINHQPLMHSAAAAYFAVFSLPGLLIIVMSITTFVLDEGFVTQQIQNYIGSFIGQNAADSVQDMIDFVLYNNAGTI